MSPIHLDVLLILTEPRLIPAQQAVGQYLPDGRGIEARRAGLPDTAVGTFDQSLMDEAKS
jgi:hypothetical protein